MKFKKTDTGIYVVRLYKGEDLIASLTDFAEKEHIGGSISGIGAMGKAELGCFELSTKKYMRKSFEGDFEILSLSGNITAKDGTFVVHAHAILGSSSFETFGGHLFSGEISITGETTVIPWHWDTISRTFDDDTHLFLWNV